MFDAAGSSWPSTAATDTAECHVTSDSKPREREKKGSGVFSQKQCLLTLEPRFGEKTPDPFFFVVNRGSAWTGAVLWFLLGRIGPLSPRAGTTERPLWQAEIE